MVSMMQKESMFNIKDIENKLVTMALARTSGHRGDAAELLGISLRSLKRRITKRRAADKEVPK